MAFSWLLNSKSVAELRVKDDGVITHSFTEQVIFFISMDLIFFVKISRNFSFFGWCEVVLKTELSFLTILFGPKSIYIIILMQLVTTFEEKLLGKKLLSY